MMNSKFVKYRIAVEFIRPDNGLKLQPSRDFDKNKINPDD